MHSNNSSAVSPVPPFCSCFSDSHLLTFTTTTIRWKLESKNLGYERTTCRSIFVQFLLAHGSQSLARYLPKLEHCEGGAGRSSTELSTKTLDMKRWSSLLWQLFCFYLLLYFSSAKDVETCFRYAFLVVLLSKRHWMLWILVYSHKFLTRHICNFLVLNGGTEEKIWSDECAHKGKRTDRQEDPSRPKDSSTERYYLWKAGLTPRYFYVTLAAKRVLNTKNWTPENKSCKKSVSNWWNNVWSLLQLCKPIQGLD